MNDLLARLDGGSVLALDLTFTITPITLPPLIVVMMASSTRTIITLSFIRDAMGVQQTPLNMVLVRVALFLALYVMNPVIGKINEGAYQPYVRGGTTQQEAADRMGGPLKEFTLRSTEKSTLDHFAQMSGTDIRESVEDYPLTVVTPAFMTNRLKRSFVSGSPIYPPFLLIDMVVAITLISMGMVMLPPTMITFPFKLLLLATVDRWELLFSNII